MRHDIWDDEAHEGTGALVWPAVMAAAILVGLAAGQVNVITGILAALLVVVGMFLRMWHRGEQ